MFAAMFKALRRVLDNTLVPAILAIAAVVMEWGISLISWFMVAIANTLIVALGWIMNAIPFPEIVVDENTFGAKFLDLAEIMGIWPAMTFYISALAVVFITRIITLGVVGR